MKNRITYIAFLLCLVTFAGYAANKQITVDKNGTADFISLQEAINSVRSFNPEGNVRIFIKEGVYKEKIDIPIHICNITLIGESKEQTIITFDDYAALNDMGTFKTYSMKIQGNDITLENLTIENAAGLVGQAVALHLEGDRIIVRNCKILGNQDTIFTGREAGRYYFEECYIEGTTDYIFGHSTCWFEKCELHCKANSYITAASTPQYIDYGYIFNNCRVTLADDVTKVWLGRPWRAYSMVLFMNTWLPQGIRLLGWHNWGRTENEETARYMEYNNSGPGSDTSGRVAWTKQLTLQEATQYTIENVMKGCDGWNPTIQKSLKSNK